MHPCLNDSLWQLLLQSMHHLLQSFKQLDLTTEVAGLSRARKPAVDSSDSSSGGGGSGNRHASRLPDPHSLVSWVRAQPDEGEGEQGLLPGLCILTERWMSEVCASRRCCAHLYLSRIYDMPSEVLQCCISRHDRPASMETIQTGKLW